MITRTIVCYIHTELFQELTKDGAQWRLWGPLTYQPHSTLSQPPPTCPFSYKQFKGTGLLISFLLLSFSIVLVELSREKDEAKAGVSWVRPQLWLVSLAFRPNRHQSPLPEHTELV